MPSSAQVSFISTPFSHSTTSTTSSGVNNEPTSSKISRLIADFIGFWSQGTYHHETKAIQNQVKERDFQVGFSTKATNEEISELINGYVIARSMLQTTERRETGIKLKISQDFLAKVFGLVGHKTAQKIILAEYDLMAQGVLKFKGKASQNHLYIINSFILRSLSLVNIPFQSKEFFNIFELFNNFLFKTPLIQENQLWCFERKDNLEKNQMLLKSDRQVFSQIPSKECSDDHVTEDHDKCSTASRSSITIQERNFEMLDIESGNILEFGPQKTTFEVQPLFEIYEGFFMGDLDIDFNPLDNYLSNFDQEKKQNYQKYHNNYNNHYQPQRPWQPSKSLMQNNQEIIQLNLFTLPPNPNFVQTNYTMGLSFPRVQNNVHHHIAPSKPKPKMQAKNIQNQKPKEKITPKPKKQEEKGFKLWDMISVNGKLKKN